MTQSLHVATPPQPPRPPSPARTLEALPATAALLIADLHGEYATVLSTDAPLAAL